MNDTQVYTERKNYENLFDDCYKQLFAIALLKTNNYHDAQDAVQETYYYAYKNIKKLRQEEFFKTWITKILFNNINKYYLKKKREEDIDQFLNDRNISTENSCINDEIILKDAMETLDKKFYDIVVLHYFVGYSVPEIAKSLGIPEGTVKSRLSRSIEKLRIYFGEDNYASK